MRLKALALMTIAGTLSGCEVIGNLYPSIPELSARRDWEGQTIQQAYKTNGQPREVVKTNDGQSMAVWTYIMTREVTNSANVVGAGPGPGGVSITPTSSTSTLTSRCDIQMTYDKNGIITRYNAWNREPMACNRYFRGY
jgi:hypothetical protein